MTMDEITDQIASTLISKGGYRRAQLPLRIHDIDFRFDAVLVGPEGEAGLVVVSNLREDSASRIVRKLSGLVTLLDRLKSRRSVSLVLVIRSDWVMNTQELEKLCHVVVVRPELAIEGSLRTLIPLRLPAAELQSEGAREVLINEMRSSNIDSRMEVLVQAADISESNVLKSIEQVINELISFANEGSND